MPAFSNVKGTAAYANPVKGVPSPIVGVADAGTGLAMALYLVLVLTNGNIKTLAQDALQDWGYLEWLVAVVILYAIYRIVDNKVVAWMIIAGVLAVLVKIGVSPQLTTSITNFGQGKQGLFATLAGVGGKQTSPTVSTQAPKPVTLPGTQTTPQITSA